MLKYSRNYYAEFKITERDSEKVINEEVITISYPTTLNFQMSLGGLNNNNAGVFQFYNLSSDLRGKLWVDIYNIGTKRIIMTLYAGYGDNMPMVFQGWVNFCTSNKASGSVDWITEVQALVGGEMYQRSYINTTFTKGTTLTDVVNYMLDDNAEITTGCITQQIPAFSRNRTFIGQTLDLLGREYAGYDIFIDKGKLHILGDNEVVKGDLLVITSESGLLGTPRRANAFVEVDMLFEPQIKIGQAISLLSDSSEYIKGLNQAYKVVAIQHSGTISARVCGTLKTTLTLSAMEGTPQPLEEAKAVTYESEPTTAWNKPVENGKVTSPFGKRSAPTAGASTYHQGIDIGVAMNTPVYAPANGKVTLADWYGGYGKCIQLNNGTINGKAVSSLFGHLSSWVPKKGDTVYKGQLIGYVGSTGVSTGPHLHFEVKENGNPVNPLIYIGNL